MSQPEAGAIGAAEAERLFASLAHARRVLAAVSGGPDSTALMGLLAAWSRATPGAPPVHVVTFDHGFRAQSDVEAIDVGVSARSLGLPHDVVDWDDAGHVKPRTRLHEASRNARYAAFEALAQIKDASHLVTAHTLDDQAETLLFRMARGSSVGGLAGMRANSRRGPLMHVRPFIGISKARLVATCITQGWSFATDPGNIDDRFARARWRKLMPALASEGLDAARLGRLAIRAARVDEALDGVAVDAVARARLVTGEAGLYDAVALLGRPPFEVALRALALLLRRPGSPGLRLDRLEAATQRMRTALDAKRECRLTLGGSVVSLQAGRLLVAIEAPRRRGLRDTRCGGPLPGEGDTRVMARPLCGAPHGPASL